MKNRFISLFEDTLGNKVIKKETKKYKIAPKSYAATKTSKCDQMSEVVVNDDEFVLDVLQFFFEERLESNQLNDELREIAATMLWTASENSKKMHGVPRPPAGIPSPVWLITDRVQAAFRKANNKCIYKAIRNKAAANFRSAYEIAKINAAAGLTHHMNGNYVHAKSTKIDYTIPGTIDILAQPSGMSCWATVYTMLESWRRQQSIAIETAVGDLGTKWLKLFKDDTGLSADDKKVFVKTAGLVDYAPFNPSIEGWEGMLKDYGPIWVTTNEIPGFNWAIHARIIIGIKGDGTPKGTEFTIIDPAGGRKYQESIETFWPKFEDEMFRTGNERIQILHWPANVQSQSISRAYNGKMSYGHQLASQLSHDEIKSLIKSVQFSSIPLDPGTGGRSIGIEALEVGDIILTTTNSNISKAIRRMTSSPVSHTILYIGNGQVVEAVAAGVVMNQLEDALKGATLAVAFRHPGLTPNKALQVRDFVGQQLDKPYNKWGIVKQAAFQIDKRVCEIFRDPERKNNCINFVGRVDLGTASNDTFFCSELVLKAYQEIGLPLTTTPPHWNSLMI